MYHGVRSSAALDDVMTGSSEMGVVGYGAWRCSLAGESRANDDTMPFRLMCEWRGQMHLASCSGFCPAKSQAACLEVGDWAGLADDAMGGTRRDWWVCC